MQGFTLKRGLRDFRGEGFVYAAAVVALEGGSGGERNQGGDDFRVEGFST